ncbi:MAG: 4-hydroxybenzoate octaprenyltransferase [Hydrogenophilaceae bacterium]|nr:4-hydroxybenzoate octaprenyltransferase [Hydrogenophilaceae bacterium]
MPSSIHPYIRLLRLDRPVGILLLLWPTLWGLWFAAEGLPPLTILMVFVVGVVLMRSAGCAINDYADRGFDAHVERTQSRPLATGEVTSKEALLLAGVLSIVAFILILPLNRLVILLSVPALLLAATYPFTKRFFAIPQAYLGVAFGFGIPMAYAAVRNEVPTEAWLLLAANLFWSVAYDTEYAMVDRPDDLKIGIKTSAITFGRLDVAAIAFCYLTSLMLLAYTGIRVELGLLYFAGLVAAGAIASYHLWLIRNRERKACFKAFLHNTWFGFAVFAGLIVDHLARY